MNKTLNSIKNYFDLNKKSGHTVQIQMFIPKKAEPELKEEPRKKLPKGHTLLGQIFLYFAIFLGVFFSDFVYQYQSDLSNFTISIGKILFSLFVSLCLIPLVYDKLKIKPESPYIYQFSLFFQQGILWKTIFQLF